MKYKITLFAFLIGFSFSSKAQSWQSLPDIPAKFTFPVVVELDGKIHIMGGGGASGATKAHYQYDPATEKWQSRADIPYAAQQPAGAAVAGKIHFFGGGIPNSGSPVDSHFIYDPKTDSWAPGAKLSAPRAIHDAVAHDGKLYSFGGQGMKDLCEVYDPSTDKWTKLGNLPDQNFWYGAHVSDGKNIYRFCGGGYTSPVNSVHIYDPLTDKWTALPNFPEAVHAMSAAVLNGIIYLTGGYYKFDEQAKVWAFDPSDKSYHSLKEMPDGRNYHRSVAVGNCLYVLGGNNQLISDMSTQLDQWCPWALSIETNKHNELQANYNQGKLHLSLKNLGQTQQQVKLYNLSGQLVGTEIIDFHSGNGSCSISLKPKSIFLVKLEDGEQSHTVKLNTF